jgi:hypothetical protein
MDMWTVRASRDYELYNLEIVITQRDYILFIDAPNQYDSPPVFSHIINRGDASLEDAQALLMKVVDNYLNFKVWIHSNDVDTL